MVVDDSIAKESEMSKLTKAAKATVRIKSARKRSQLSDLPEPSRAAASVDPSLPRPAVEQHVAIELTNQLAIPHLVAAASEGKHAYNKASIVNGGGHLASRETPKKPLRVSIPRQALISSKKMYASIFRVPN